MQPDLFRLDDEGKPQPISVELTDEVLAAATEAAEICPSQAISIVD
jgi:ferredoxin